MKFSQKFLANSKRPLLASLHKFGVFTILRLSETCFRVCLCNELAGTIWARTGMELLYSFSLVHR